MSLTLPSFSAGLPQITPLAEQVLALRRRWQIILVATLAVPLLAGWSIMRVPMTYTATGIILYDPGAAIVPGSDASLPQSVLDEDAVIGSQGAIITSLPQTARIAAQLDLIDNPEFNPKLRKRHFPFSAPKAPTAEELAETVQGRLNVAVEPGSRVLTVTFTSGSAQLAADGANLAMSLYLDHERDTAFASLTDAQAWLEKHAEDIQAQLDTTEAQLAQARAAAGVVQGAQASLTTETVSHLAAQLVQAQAQVAMDQARLNASGADAAAASAAIAPNLLPLRKEQADLSAQVQSLATEYGPDYPPLAQAQAQLSAISTEITDETSREVDSARADVDADAAQVATLQAALNSARAQSQSEDEESGPIRALEQRAGAAQDMLRAITQQAGQLAQDASLTKPDARILSTAAVPSAPNKPHAALMLVAATVLGFCAGLLLAALATALDTTIRSGEDIRALFGLTCLALLPETVDPHHAGLSSPFSLYAEQLRALRAGLALKPGQGRIIAITAARPGEGKTTLAIALGRALANGGLRVLAVDGDIRQPSFDRVFNAGGALGLTDHLAGLAPLEGAFLQDDLTPLEILPAGTQAKAALSLFLSPALPACLETLRAMYDVVLIDAPPAYALAEGRVLARLADVALMCVRWGHTPRRVVRGAITLLRENGVTLEGTVMTRVDVARHGKSGYADAEVYQPRYGGYFRH